MRFVDTNVFIYELVQSPKNDYEIADRILQRIENGEEAATSLPVIQEVIDWFQYNKRRKEIGSFLLVINSYLSLTKLATSWDNFIPSIKYMNSKQLGFIDSLTLQVMKENGISEIYSNDKDFDRVDWVKRIWE
jgi:predicted nucleic acid-binding protein